MLIWMVKAMVSGTLGRVTGLEIRGHLIAVSVAKQGPAFHETAVCRDVDSAAGSSAPSSLSPQQPPGHL